MITINKDGSVTAETGDRSFNGYIHLHSEGDGNVYAWTNFYGNPTYLKVSRRFNTVMLIQFEDQEFADEYFEEHPLADHEYLIWFGKE